jgi:hypothetical protein
VTVTTEVAPADNEVDRNFTVDELVEPDTVKLHAEEIVGAVCTHDQLKERPAVEATATSGS